VLKSISLWADKHEDNIRFFPFSSHAWCHRECWAVILDC